MSRHSRHPELHRADRVGWLRAAVLGANDGIVSVAGLVVGVAASGASASTILATGIAGTVAGAMSMAAGEYVSVQTQADTEAADLAMEKRELHEDPHSELDELTAIYRHRGLQPALARQVAEQLTAHDALGAHARDELGITDTLRARPLQAALASAGAFACGAALPVLTALFSSPERVTLATTVSTLLGLCLTGAMAAHAGGAPATRGAMRVMFWGALAMAAAAGIGRLLGAHVS
ncbi:VIT1/CCC1 transporter family protein [Stenotrophomonas sp. NPDC077659]|uniref:VIT1/CCC1 transporter family protein n=1 Tax=Stenotrophomonas sp. NPDC077659 TaxID=3390694 RepID=UPI003CFE56DC